MSNIDPSHDAQLMYMMKRTPVYSAVGGFLGALIALLLVWLICGCPCGHHDDKADTNKAAQLNQSSLTAPLATKGLIRFI